MNLILILLTFFLANILFFLPLPQWWVQALEVAVVILLGAAFMVETFLVIRRRAERETLDSCRTHAAPAPPAGPEAVAAPVPLPAATAEADVVQFLGRLQEKGRLVDFAMEEIAAYPDEQVGAVARVVHQGVREVLKASFDIRPVHGGEEGEEVSLAGDYDARAYRLVGKVPERSPFRGAVRHRGWKTSKVSLPRVSADPVAKEIIAPAEVEIG